MTGHSAAAAAIQKKKKTLKTPLVSNYKSRLHVRLVLRRVEVEAKCGEVWAQRQVDHAGVGLRRPDERQQANHSKLVCYHATRDIGHSPWDTKTTEDYGLA